ncbi:putative transcription factor WRKY family [Helianthus anomalus]
MHKKVSSGHKRIHYKCQVPLCLIKKTVETSSDGYNIGIIYRGKHNHTKPRSTIRSPSDQQIVKIKYSETVAVAPTVVDRGGDGVLYDKTNNSM